MSDSYEMVIFKWIKNKQLNKYSMISKRMTHELDILVKCKQCSLVTKQMTRSRISESISLSTVTDCLFMWQSVGKDTHYTFYERYFIKINKWKML